MECVVGENEGVTKFEVNKEYPKSHNNKVSFDKNNITNNSESINKKNDNNRFNLSEILYSKSH